MIRIMIRARADLPHFRSQPAAGDDLEICDDNYPQEEGVKKPPAASFSALIALATFLPVIASFLDSTSSTRLRISYSLF